MGDVEKKREFEWMIKLCQPTPSQEEALIHCPFARDSEDPISSSSLGPTQSDYTQIFMLSVPDTNKPADEEEDDAVFVTPPEHHLRSSSSSDQNVVDLRDGLPEKKRVRVSQEGLGDEAVSKKIRVSQGEDTLPVGDTQLVDVEIGGNKSVRNSEVVVLDSDEETVNLGEDIVEPGEIRFKGSGHNAGGEYRKNSTSVQKVEVNKNEQHSQKRNTKGGLGSIKIESEILKVKCVETRAESVENEEHSQKRDFKEGGLGDSKIESEIVKLKRIETRAESAIGVSEKVVNVMENGKVCKDGVNGDVRPGTSYNGLDEIDKFLYTGSGDAKKQGRVNSAAAAAGRKLPVSMQGEENNNVVKKKSELSDIVKMLELVVGDGDGDGSEDVDFLETARKQGMIFPRPRWWLPEGRGW